MGDEVDERKILRGVQLQGDLQTLEQKHEDPVIRGTEREKELDP